MEEQVSNYIQKLHLKEGDALFIDAEAVDIQHLKSLGLIKVPIIAVYRTPGMSVADHLAVAANPND